MEGRPQWKRVCSAGVRLGLDGDDRVAEMVGCLFAVTAVLEYVACRKVVFSPYCSVIGTIAPSCSIDCGIDSLLDSYDVVLRRPFSSFKVS